MATATAVSRQEGEGLRGQQGSQARRLYEKISQRDMAPLWEVLKDLVAKEPKSIAAPAIWHFDEVKPMVEEAGALLTARGSRAPRAGAGKSGFARPVAHHRIRFMPACS